MSSYMQGEITTAASLNQQRYYIFTVRVTDDLSYSGYTSVSDWYNFTVFS